jgi:competence protein ComEA
MFPWLKTLFAEFTPRAIKAAITGIAVVGFAGYLFGSATVVTPKVAVLAHSKTTSVAPAKQRIYVHIAGSVKHPGIYQLDSGARVYEAVLEAGGLTSKANQMSINLARVLNDGEQLVVASTSQVINQQFSIPNQPALISINQASETQLEDLPGVGPALAGRIVDWRTANGGFKSKEDLMNVSGIGDKLYAGVKDLVTL